MQPKLLLLIPLLAFLTLSLFAQSNYEDVVYLKNGSIIRGTIIEQVPNESLKIQTVDKNVFVFKMEEILKITKEEKPAKSRNVRERLATQERKKSGFTNITELTFARGLENRETQYDYNGNTTSYETRADEINNNPSFGIQTVNGFQVNPHFSFGLGVGMHAYRRLMLVPLFFDLRYTILDKRLSPFVATEFGTAFSLNEITGWKTDLSDNEDERGGLMGNLAVGGKFFVHPKMALILSLGLRYQEMDVNNGENNGFGYSKVSTVSIRMLNVRFGFNF